MHKYSGTINTSNARNSTPNVSTAIVGARGYSGVELARILAKHPHSNLTACYATQKFNLTDYIFDSQIKNVPCFTDSEINANVADVWFLATPAEASLKLAPLLLEQGKTVIDLSGAFRLKTSSYEKWYNFSHTRSDLLKNATYGLSPFAKPSTSALVANPGCYATAILMALLPLLKKDLIHKDIVIDAKSGTTGAGRKAAENLIFSEVTGDFLPYRTGKHQHIPEITETIKQICNLDVDLQMTTHLLPIDRGISAAIYAKPKTTDVSLIEKAYAEAYENYPLVKIQKGEGPLLNLKHVVNTPNTHISFDMVENKLYIFSMIDNLLKGAASQAVENFNRHFDLPPTTGI